MLNGLANLQVDQHWSGLLFIGKLIQSLKVQCIKLNWIDICKSSHGLSRYQGLDGEVFVPSEFLKGFLISVRHTWVIARGGYVTCALSSGKPISQTNFSLSFFLLGEANFFVQSEAYFSNSLTLFLY